MQWEWEEAKFQLKTPLRELSESISLRISSLDEELKVKTGELQVLRASLQAIERKTQGNLMVRGLADLVDESAVSSYSMAFALADCADSAGYIVGPLLGLALCRVLRSRAWGLLLVGIACTALVPRTLHVGRLDGTARSQAVAARVSGGSASHREERTNTRECAIDET